MTRHTHDPIAREADKLADQDHQEREAIAAARKDWRAKWPHHCTECGGWGGSTSYQSHPYGSTTATETLFEPCDAKNPTICHRCGTPGMVDPWGNELEMCWKCLWRPGEDGVPRA